MPHLTASLCEAVTERTESDRMLDHLERAHLFLVPFDGSLEWYRYHALFAEAMRCEARRRFGEERLRDLALKACYWYDAHGISLVNLGKEVQLVGRLNESRQFLTQGSICCEAVRNIYALLAATILLGDVCFAQGELYQATRYYQRVSEMAAGKWHALYEQGKKALDDRGLTQIGLARLSYEWNELETAEQQASEGLPIGEQLNNESLCVSASLILARIWQASGESERAQQFLEEQTRCINMPWHVRDVLLEQAWLALVNGDLNTVRRRITSLHLLISSKQLKSFRQDIGYGLR